MLSVLQLLGNQKLKFKAKMQLQLLQLLKLLLFIWSQ